MLVIWGCVLIALGGLAWCGQVVSAVSHKCATRMGLSEPEESIDSAFYADVRGEAVWDSLVLWTLPVAGVLALMDSAWWPHLGLIGGAMYAYFAGRGIFQRKVMQRRGIRIGETAQLRAVYTFLGIWGLAGVITIALALRELAEF